MFESIFEKLGRKVSNNSGKIIVIWIVLLLLMGYGALLVFSHTNFNIENGFGSSNSMSEKASNELSQYFNSSAGTGSSGSSSELIVVTQNTNVSSATDFTNLVNYVNEANKTASADSNFTGIESIVGTENQTMLSFSTGMKKILDTNFQTLTSLGGVEESANLTSQIFLSLETNYYFEFINYEDKTKNYSSAEGVAYNVSHYAADQLSLEVKSNAPVIFVNIFARFVNHSYSPSMNLISLIGEGVKSAILNSSFNEAIHSSPVLDPIYQEILFYLGNQNLTLFMNSPKSSTIYLSEGLLNKSGTLAELSSFIQKFDNSSISLVLSSIYQNMGAEDTISNLEYTHLSVNLTVSAALNQFKGNPLVKVDKSVLSSYFSELNNTSASVLSNSYMESHSLFQMPVQPTSYLLHNFVGYDNSTAIIIFTFKGNYTNAVAKNITSVSISYEKKFAGGKFLIAGSQEFASQLEGEITSGLFKALGAGVALSILVVGLFFRSVKAAFIPIMIFIISAVISLGIVGYLYTYVFHTGVSFITPTLLFIFILGLSSDYTVYLMARYRKELRKGTEHPTIASSRWAGHAVFTSGLTVIISEVVLWLANIPFFSDAGLANAIGVSVTLALATTFLLSILHRYGKRIFRKSSTGEFVEGNHRIMKKVGLFSTKNKVAMIAIFLIFALIGVTIYESTPTGIDMLKLLPRSQAITAIEVVNNSFNGDFFDRNFIVIGLASPLITSVGNKITVNQTEMATVSSIENRTLETKGISMVLGPGRPYGYYYGVPDVIYKNQSQIYANQSLSFVSSENSRYVEIVFQTYYLGWGSKAITTVANLYNNIKPSSPSSYTVEIGGLTQALSDALSSTQVSFSELIPILTITIFIILLIQLSSILTPARLIIMVIAAVLVSLSVSYVIFHYIQGFPVVIFMPVFVFITLLAVGLDYDIFMITRVREEVIKGASLKDALITSVSENGGVIMLLGSLLFVTFAALYFSAIPLIQEIGIGVGLGVLIDTFISWPFFIPAVMLIIKKYNWWPSKLEDKN
ncbi:MMPL family transporter [Cuniculiplasma sp. SKW4]|uniref:MMPL family transporter n=1 Tax=Cuniculiplasma sp. SKW4 TaxID=3400171 RepID=UPI003FD51BE0